MEEFFVIYHIGNQTVSEILESEQLIVAINTIDKRVKEREWIRVVKTDDKVIDIRTSSITHYEVLTKKQVEFEREFNFLPKFSRDALVK